MRNVIFHMQCARTTRVNVRRLLRKMERIVNQLVNYYVIEYTIHMFQLFFMKSDNEPLAYCHDPKICKMEISSYVVAFYRAALYLCDYDFMLSCECPDGFSPHEDKGFCIAGIYTFLKLREIYYNYY